MKIQLAILPGDGIGPEIIAKAFAEGSLVSRHPLLVAGDPEVMLRAASLYDPSAEICRKAADRFQLTLNSRKLTIQRLSSLDISELRYGQPDTACGRAMAD